MALHPRRCNQSKGSNRSTFWSLQNAPRRGRQPIPQVQVIPAAASVREAGWGITVVAGVARRAIAAVAAAAGVPACLSVCVREEEEAFMGRVWSDFGQVKENGEERRSCAELG